MKLVFDAVRVAKPNTDRDMLLDIWVRVVRREDRDKIESGHGDRVELEKRLDESFEHVQ